MSIPFVRRTLVFLLLVLALTVSAASAGQTSASPRGLAAAKAASLDILGRLWSLFTGCMIDPDGRCLAAPVAQGDEGCMIDPSGRCATRTAPTARGDEGCMIDPDGRCRG
jgi:hypothetical protein